MRKKIEMSLIKSPANGVVIKRKISDGLKEIVSLKEKILLETTAKIQSIEEREKKNLFKVIMMAIQKALLMRWIILYP
ncbi:putative oxygen-regulated invasion protein [Escherichia coli]|nr:putative oxygen-regulated invasion protein [Escherichia coli]